MDEHVEAIVGVVVQSMDAHRKTRAALPSISPDVEMTELTKVIPVEEKGHEAGLFGRARSSSKEEMAKRLAAIDDRLNLLESRLSS